MPNLQTFAEGSQHAASERAALAHENITLIRNRLTQIPATLGGAWQGEAAAKYQQMLAAWQPELEKVLAALDRIAQNLKGSGIEYTEAVVKASELSTRLHAQLNATAPTP